MYQVIAKCRYIGFHRWPQAPDSHAYLRERHRHEFHVKVTVAVRDPDRAIECHTLKSLALDAMGVIGPEFGDRSCERIAQHVAESVCLWRVLTSKDGPRGPVAVEVLEDGECGGAFVIF